MPRFGGKRGSGLTAPALVTTTPIVACGIVVATTGAATIIARLDFARRGDIVATMATSTAIAIVSRFHFASGHSAEGHRPDANCQKSGGCHLTNVPP